MKYLPEVKPVTKFEEAIKLQQKFSKGFMKDDFFYGNRIKIVENMTYVLRSTAYEGEVPKKKECIAFGIVRKENVGRVTLL